MVQLLAQPALGATRRFPCVAASQAGSGLLRKPCRFECRSECRSECLSECRSWPPGARLRLSKVAARRAASPPPPLTPQAPSRPEQPPSVGAERIAVGPKWGPRGSAGGIMTLLRASKTVPWATSTTWSARVYAACVCASLLDAGKVVCASIVETRSSLRCVRLVKSEAPPAAASAETCTRGTPGGKRRAIAFTCEPRG